MDNLNEELRQMAVSHGLCEKWQGDWRKDWSMDEMVNRFFKGIDFYAKERFIPKEFFKEKLSLVFRRQHGILVDDKYSMTNKRYAAIIGNSSSTLRYGLWNTAEVVIFDTSSVKIYANTKAFVMVHVYDKATVTAETKDEARIILIRHSEQCVTEGKGDVRIRS